MDLAKSFDPGSIESRWYAEWEQRGFFEPAGGSSTSSYCVQLPPPNVTGTLHMGHAFQQTLMDALIRYHRMRGFDTNWIVGTDHAGIATQIVVERQLEMEGKTRHDLGRDAFVKRVWEWKSQSGSTITGQMRRLGASANWRYADSEGKASGYFTMDDSMSRSVAEVFVRLHEQGLIYRGKRLVNWDPVLGTAVSDLEVDTEDEDGKIWEIRYPLEDGSGALVVATTRPETLLGDVAVAVNPADERYTLFVGKRVLLPLVNKAIPVIQDDYVDPAFGTGCVKITPAHDFNDHAVGLRHALPMVEILTLEAKISEQAPPKYRGLDRFVARKRVLADLAEQGLLVSEKPHRLRVPRSGRTGVIVEPMLTDQWFVRMESLAKPALDAVAHGSVRFFPEHWTTTYNHWLENIQDWCISRQLWWGHRVPAWYDETGSVFVARTEAEALELARRAGSTGPLRQDNDVLDTWFSSALVPFSALGWPGDTPDLSRYLPSSVLVTGFDIIFFWVARMVMMSLHFTGQVPFRHVYINALVRDAEGQKMSKSKGNTLDPLDLIDGVTLEQLIAKSTTGLLRAEHRAKIERYLRQHFPSGIPAFGADALRFTFASLATFARTLNFDMSRCEGYRNFCNKLWNASRFVLMNVEGQDCGPHIPIAENMSVADQWITSALQRTVLEVHDSFENYRFDNAAAALYKFVWDEYCDWYLEMAKTQLGSGTQAEKIATRRTLVNVLDAVLRLTHPIIPFITEELWQYVGPLSGVAGSIMLAPYPTADDTQINEPAERTIAGWKSFISVTRNLREAAKVPPSRKVPLHASGGELEDLRALEPYLGALAKVSELTLGGNPIGQDMPAAMSGPYKLTLLIEVDVAEERSRLGREISRVEKEVVRLQAKLANASFVERAPSEVVAVERQRLEEFKASLEQLTPQLQRLSTSQKPQDSP